MIQTSRINGFDALRTMAMWLGVLLHSLIVYKSQPEPNWPQDKAVNLQFLDWVYHFIHIFRMPLFFLVAGYFARMVIIKSGVRYFTKQRAIRILLPFLAGVIIIVPITLLPFHFYRFYHEQGMPIDIALKNSFSQILKWNGLAHLWFLYYLILFYLSSLGVFFITRQWKKFKSGKDITNQFPGNISLFKLLIPIGILFMILFSYKVDLPPVYTGVKPSLLYLLYYGLFYYSGWILQMNKSSIVSLTKNCTWLFVLGIALSFIHIVFFKSSATGFLLSATETIILVTSITGLFIKYFQKENKTWRYFSDAAYWVYLIHLPVVAATQIILFNSFVPPLLRLPIVLITAFVISLLTYHYLVRYTFIGTILHGRKEKSAKQTRKESSKTSTNELVN